MIPAGLWLDMVTDRNIFLEKEGEKIFEWKDPFFTSPPFIQEIDKKRQGPLLTDTVMSS